MMKSLISLMLCSVFLFVCLLPENNGYEFDNPELNTYLKQSMEDYSYEAEVEEDGSSFRPRRNAKDADDDKFVCKHKHFKSCCGDENIMKKLHDKEKPVGKACHKNVTARFEQMNVNTERANPMDFFSCEGMTNMKKKIYCVNECIGKGLNLLNEDGSLNEEKTRVFVIGEGFKDDWFKDLVSTGLDECLKKDFYKVSFPKEEYPTSTSTDNTALECNPTYLQFLSCLYKEIEMGCPDQYQKKSKKCKAMRENFITNKKRMLDMLQN